MGKITYISPEVRVFKVAPTAIMTQSPADYGVPGAPGVPPGEKEMPNW